MRVTEMGTSRSHILRKNKPVLLGRTALRLCLNKLINVVFRCSSFFFFFNKDTCSCPLISKVSSREGIIGLYWVSIAKLWLLQTVKYLTLTMVAKFIS